MAAAVAVALGYLATGMPASAQPGTEDDTRAASSVSGRVIEEVIVSAQRRDQRVIDVPYNISAISGSDLAASSATNASDLIKVVAGLSNYSDGPSDRYGQNNFSLRGLNTDPLNGTSNKYTVSTVATYYGDTPVFYPILLKDLNRVEVLRGPQGTLYGSGAQGGAIRFIPNGPSFDGVSGQLNASAGMTAKSDDLNSSVDGVINVPLSDNLALRVTGAYVKQAGFIDQVNLFERDANGVPVPSVPGDLSSGPVIAPVKEDTNSWDQTMVRGALRYVPTDWLDLEVSYLHQKTDSDDVNMSNPDYQGGTRDMTNGLLPESAYETRPGSDYENTQSILQPLKSKLDLVSGTASIDLGFAELTSISSHYRTKTDSTTDWGYIYINPAVNFASYYNFYPRFVADVQFDGEEKGFTQEIRLVSQGDSAFSYVLGAYYSDQDKTNKFPIFVPGLQDYSTAVCEAGSPACIFSGANPQLPDLVFTSTQKFDTEDKAVFGELTYRITDAWQVTGGFRAFKVKQEFDSFQKYPFWGAGQGDGVTEPVSQGASSFVQSASSSDQIYKINTSYDLNPDNMIYMTFAQGFRRGGANALSDTGPTASLPEFLSYQPEIADNYEIGIKGRTASDRLQYSLAAFRIELEDFQFNGLTPNFYSAVFNGDKAVTKGFEFEGSFRATPNLTLSASYAYTTTDVPDTVVIRDLAPRALIDGFQESDIIVNPNATILEGSELPGVSKHSANAAIGYEIPLSGNSLLLLHTNFMYRSEQDNLISVESVNYREIPEIFTVDARITYDSGDAWSVSLYGHNLTNELASTGDQGVQTQNVSEPQSLIYASQIVGTPRTIGLRLQYDF
jgi:outer membrane receptor protein involved in Fe transport